MISTLCPPTVVALNVKGVGLNSGGLYYPGSVLHVFLLSFRFLSLFSVDYGTYAFLGQECALQFVPRAGNYASLDRPPDVLVIHAGANDLGFRSSRELVRDVRLDIIIIVWSNMVVQ